ncbi:MAG: hypothetical protein AABX01_00265 [Candidatus Micrarchaeota archaeon]
MRALDKNTALIIIIAGIVLLVAAFYIFKTKPIPNEPAFIGERLESVPLGVGCKAVCEAAAGVECFSRFEICQSAGANDLMACSEYLTANPQVLDNYRCTFSVSQTMEGATEYTCSFSCK